MPQAPIDPISDEPEFPDIQISIDGDFYLKETSYKVGDILGDLIRFNAWSPIGKLWFPHIESEKIEAVITFAQVCVDRFLPTSRSVAFEEPWIEEVFLWGARHDIPTESIRVFLWASKFRFAHDIRETKDPAKYLIEVLQQAGRFWEKKAD